MYKVTTPKGLTPTQAFDTVNNVRQQYDNLGVSPAGAGSEVYTVNTKIWVPSELLDIEVKESKCDMDFIEDLENYQKRVAYAANIPLGYLDPNGGEGSTYVSGISLMEQYKPFARHVYSIQSIVLDTIGMLIRMHYAITGEFDYNTPFILSMRFPAIEMSDEKRQARQSSIDLSQGIVDLLKDVLGISDEDTLPEDVVTDILSKYSFLDPTEVQKWMRLSAFLKPAKNSGDGGDDEFGGDDFGGGGSDDFGGDDMGGGDDAGGADELPESRKINLEKKKYLREKKEREVEHLREIRERYKNAADDIYMHFVESNSLSDWNNVNTKKHCLYVPKITEGSEVYESFKVISNNKKGGKTKLNEAQVNELMQGIRARKPKKISKLASATDNKLSTIETALSASAAATALRESGVNINQQLKIARENIKNYGEEKHI
jgi:hypothetical protein